jgi:hypothetical protein
MMVLTEMHTATISILLMATEYKLKSVKNKGEIAYLYWEAESVGGAPSKEIWTSKGLLPQAKQAYSINCLG